MLVTSIRPDGKRFTADCTVGGERRITDWPKKPTEAQVLAYHEAQAKREAAEAEAARALLARELRNQALVGTVIDDWTVASAETVPSGVRLTLVPKPLRVAIPSVEVADAPAALRLRLAAGARLLDCIANTTQRAVGTRWSLFARSILIGDRAATKAAVTALVAQGNMTAADANRMQAVYDALLPEEK